MSKDDVVAFWRREAKEALIAAELMHEKGIYWHALFDCHLAVEKALKALYVEERDEHPPPTHELIEIADGLNRKWKKGLISVFDSLTDFAVESRCHDEQWLAQNATEEHAREWIEQTKSLLSDLIP